MAKKDEKLWNHNFELYKEYVNEFSKFPSITTEYKKVAIGNWLHNQISFYRAGELAVEREKLLNGFNPVWKGNGKEKEQENRRLLFLSNWKKKIPEGNTPIDVFLEEEELYKCIRKGIYDCESWIAYNRNIAPLDKVLVCYSKIFPFIEPKYLYFLHLVKGKNIGNLSETRTFLEQFEFSSYIDVQQRMERFLGMLDDKEQKIIKMYYFDDYTMGIIAEKVGLCPDHVRRVRKAALSKLMLPSRLDILYNRPFEVKEIRDLGLSVRVTNNLRRCGIFTVSKLIYIMNNEPRKLMEVRNMGESSIAEITEKIKKLKTNM